jgi:hypothetical protein
MGKPLNISLRWVTAPPTVPGTGGIFTSDSESVARASLGKPLAVAFAIHNRKGQLVTGGGPVEIEGLHKMRPGVWQVVRLFHTSALFARFTLTHVPDPAPWE